MNKTYIERFELLGYEIDVCTSMKEFTGKIKEMCSWNPYGDVTFKKYMNDEIAGYHNCISEGFSNPDACIFIQYKDRKTYSYYPTLGTDGEFKETGIEWAIISHDYGYITYKNDLSVEWEFLELDEDEKEAIELGIPLEDYKKFKKTAERFHPVQEQAEEQEQEQEQAEEQEQEQEQTEKQTEEQEQIPSEIPFIPSDFLVKPEYKIDILEALKKAGFNSGYIRKNKIFPESTVQKFRTGNTDVSINTIFRVCQIIGKDISEVITFKKE